jgi:SAM-dependent methyltransferase
VSDDPAVERFAAAVESARDVPFVSAGPQIPGPKDYYPALLGDDEQLRTSGIRKEIRYLRDVFEGAGLLDLSESEVLEVGAGYGLGLIGVACLGARRAVGVELLSRAVDWATHVSQVLPQELRDRLEFDRGSANELPLADESVDVVLSLEAISHYLDYKPFLHEAQRVLRPGGTLIVSDGNNGLNPLIRRRTIALWASHEEPPGAGRTRPHDYPFHFVDRRRELIEQVYPQIAADDALALALRTSGMVRAEVLDAARVYVEDGALPNRPYERAQLTVHPIEDMVMERLFNPYALARELREYGFRTRVRGHWGGASQRPLLRLANRALVSVTPLTIVTARAFRITATKGAPS